LLEDMETVILINAINLSTFFKVKFNYVKSDSYQRDLFLITK